MLQPNHVEHSDIIYVNSIINNNIEDGVPSSYRSKQAITNITYDSPIVSKASDYFLTVVKFSIPLEELPIMVFPVIPNQANPNLSTYAVGMNQAGIAPVVAATNLIWVKTNTAVQPPTQNQPIQVIDPYYYLYNYSYLATLINTALNTQFVANGSPGGVAPYFRWNIENQKFELIMTNNLYTTLNWRVYLNNPLANTLIGYSYAIINNANPVLDRNEIQTDVLQYPPDGAGNLTISQQFKGLDYVNSTRRIVITTNGLPIQREYYPLTTFGNVSRFAGANSTLGILSDFNLDISQSSGSQTGVAQYDADNFRLIQLSSDTDVRRFDLRFWWVDNFNSLNPIFIPSGDTLYIKLGFIHRDLVEQKVVDYTNFP